MNSDNELTRRPTVAFTEEEHKKVKVHCVMNNISMQDFLRKAALYCVNYGVEFDE